MMKMLQLIGILVAVFCTSLAAFAQGSDREYDERPTSIDSLLSIYYVQRSLDDTISYPDLDSLNIAADLPDEVYIQRLSKIASPIHLPYNQYIRNSIILYTQKIKKNSESILGLAEYYMPYFEEILDKYNMPLELKAMAIIESALNPTAVSRVGATGMWQFMYRTGKHYNLDVTSFVDDRRDPILSAHAAAQYLKDLYSIFNDWTLAIAAYNCGEGNVNKAIRRAGGKRDYWDIYPYLPRETRGYVPLFIGATYLMHYYKEHNLRPAITTKPIETDTVMVNRMLHFEQVAALTDIPVDVLRDLNPQYKKDIIPGKEKPYALRLPYNYVSVFVSKEDEIYAYQDSLYFNPKTLAKVAEAGATTYGKGSKVVHRVVKGDTPGGIAKQYRVSLANLRSWNNLGSKSVIRPGQKLVIYK